MKSLTASKFFRTLQEASQTGFDKEVKTLQILFDDFAKHVFSAGNATTDINTLIYTCSELGGIDAATQKKHSSLSR